MIAECGTCGAAIERIEFDFDDKAVAFVPCGHTGIVGLGYDDPPQTGGDE
jgi:hypothetical protein